MYSTNYVNIFNTCIDKMYAEHFDVNYYKSANNDLHVLDDNYAFTHFLKNITQSYI